LFSQIETVYLITLFAKNEKPNLSDAEKASAKKWLKLMKARHGQ
jgi:hypothetical protein